MIKNLHRFPSTQKDYILSQKWMAKLTDSTIAGLNNAHSHELPKKLMVFVEDRCK